MKTIAMQEVLIALKGHRGHLAFQALNRRHLGAERAEAFEARLPTVDAAIEEVKAKLDQHGGQADAW